MSDERRATAGGHRIWSSISRSSPACVDRRGGRVKAVDGSPLVVRDGETVAWSVSPAAGSRRSAGRSCNSSPPRRARSGSTARNSSGLSAGPAPAAPPDPDDLPGPVRLTEPAQARRAIVGDPLGLHGLAHGAELKRRVQELLGAGGVAGRALQTANPTGVLRRGSASASASPAPSSGPADHRRRAGVRPGRVGAGPDHQPARRSAARGSRWPTCSWRTTWAWCGRRVGPVAVMYLNKIVEATPIRSTTSAPSAHHRSAVGRPHSRSRLQNAELEITDLSRRTEPDRSAGWLPVSHPLPERPPTSAAASARPGLLDVRTSHAVWHAHH